MLDMNNKLVGIRDLKIKENNKILYDYQKVYLQLV